MLGNGRLTAQSFDGTKRLAIIRGGMVRVVWASLSCGAADAATHLPCMPRAVARASSSHTHTHTRTLKQRKKVWIQLDDIILLSLRDYQDDKADVIHKYTSDEARELLKMGHIPEHVRFNDPTEAAEGEEGADDGSSSDEDVAFDISAI